MASFIKVHNERSESIELIKLMDMIVKRNTWQIKSIGGESTLNTGKKRMFPDVFVYGDTARTQVLQGWEVKMPDVAIDDEAFIIDAKRKADVLGVNSCFTWNFKYGILYIKDEKGNWEKRREWNKTNHIKTRKDVTTYKKDWESLIEKILIELNDFFLTGELHSSKLGDIISDTIFIEILERNKDITAEHLKAESIRNTVIKSHILQWWRTVEKEYKFDETNPFVAYAKFILLNWVNKITFANMIKRYHIPAALVEKIAEDITPYAAVDIFKKITSECDFFNIFEAVKYGELLPRSTWEDLRDYNAFLTDNGIEDVSQESLQSVLENSVNQFKRNVAGVFATPSKLAQLLVRAGLTNLAAPCIDPCCGTGTIVKEILSEKENAIDIKSAFETTYASDKHSFSLQIAGIAMTRANAINLPSILFRSNAFDLCEGKKIQIIDPQNGENKQYEIPKMGGVMSNLPFVAFKQEGHEEVDSIKRTLNRVKSDTGIKLSGRADLYQAILFHLHTILADNAEVAIITSNSWLGTLAGQKFFHALNYYYSVESIIASGKGKWFDNADVVALMLFLKQKPELKAPDDNHKIYFGLIEKSLDSMTDEDVGNIADSIKLKSCDEPNLLTFKSYTVNSIHEILKMNIALNSCFYDVEWLSDIQRLLCPVTDLFKVFRGMKTGQDKIYYLKNASGVNSEYVGRVFKSAKSSVYLTAQPDTYSFVCNKSIAELTSLGHRKTLERINQYKGHINQSVPNKETFWMNLTGGRLSGSDNVRLFTGMNPERRIFYGLLNEPAQINQRAIGFNPLSEDINVELCHSLLNSVVGIFYAEATGFPKGLGALDNRAENVERILMLDPRRLSAEASKQIIDAFKPLLARKIMTTSEEYQQEDRLTFERTVSECFGYSELFDRMRDTVLKMQSVRLSVKNKKEDFPH